MTMHFNPVEHFIRGKSGVGHGDDRVLLGPYFSGVVDGVTGPKGSTSAECTVSAVMACPEDAEERYIHDAIQQRHVGEFGLPAPDERMPGSTAAILSHKRRKVFLYGDCSVILMGNNGYFKVYRNPKKPSWEDHLYQTRRTAIDLRLRSGKLTKDGLYDFDPGYEMLQDEIRAYQHHLANEPGGYVVLCAKPIPKKMVKVIDIGPEVMTIVMVTDGYAVKLMEREDFLSVDAIEAKQALINLEDPHCIGINLGPKGIIRNPATGKLNANYDDRAYLRIGVIHS